jgi:Uma2 family endonuclease
MDAMTLVLDQRRWTREERDALPDDGHPHELIDGALVVTPSPKSLHQLMSSNLVAALQARCPQHLRVLHAPTDVALADDTVLQPDVLVVARAQIGP